MNDELMPRNVYKLDVHRYATLTALEEFITELRKLGNDSAQEHPDVVIAVILALDSLHHDRDYTFRA